jgi:hypothetical protein
MCQNSRHSDGSGLAARIWPDRQWIRRGAAEAGHLMANTAQIPSAPGLDRLCVCKYFDAKFAPNIIGWAAFLLASLAYDFIVKTGAGSFRSQLSFQDLASKINVAFAVIAAFQFCALSLLAGLFKAFDRDKAAGQMMDFEASAMTSIASYYFVTFGNYWIAAGIAKLQRSADVQQGFINPWEYLCYGLIMLALAAAYYLVGCRIGVVGDVKKQLPP